MHDPGPLLDDNLRKRIATRHRFIVTVPDTELQFALGGRPEVFDPAIPHYPAGTQQIEWVETRNPYLEGLFRSQVTHLGFEPSGDIELGRAPWSDRVFQLKGYAIDRRTRTDGKDPAIELGERMEKRLTTIFHKVDEALMKAYAVNNEQTAIKREVESQGAHADLLEQRIESLSTRAWGLLYGLVAVGGGALVGVIW